MNRTDQAHQWTVYFVLVVFTIAICGTFAFTDKMTVGEFIAIAGMVFAFFFGKPKPGENGSGSNVVTAPPTPPST